MNILFNSSDYIRTTISTNNEYSRMFCSILLWFVKSLLYLSKSMLRIWSEKIMQQKTNESLKKDHLTIDEIRVHCAYLEEIIGIYTGGHH